MKLGWMVELLLPNNPMFLDFWILTVFGGKTPLLSYR